MHDNITIKGLRSQLQKTAPEGERETLVGTTVRFFSIYLTRIFIAFNVTPNIASTLSILTFLAGISLFTFPGLGIKFIGVGVVYLSIVFDACDGELARWRKVTGYVGSAFIEPFSHDVQYSFLFVPLALGVYFVNLDIVILGVAFVGTISKLLTRFLQVRMDGLMSLQASITNKSNAPKKSSFVRWLYWVINRNILSSVGMVLPLLVFVVIGRIDLFIWAYAIGFLGIFVLQLARKLKYIISVSNTNNKI